MPRNTKDSQTREEEEDRNDVEAPRVDEIEPDERAQSKLDEEQDEEADDDDLDDEAEDIDVENLSAMEGPDA